MTAVPSVGPVRPVLPARRALAVSVAVTITVLWSAWALWRVVGWPAFWPAPPMIAFTPYVAASSVVPVVLALLARCRRTAIVAVLAAVALLGAVVPRTVASAQPVATGPALTVMVSNLQFGRAEAAEVAAAVSARGADILVTLELTGKGIAELEVTELGDQLPYRYLVPGKNAEGSGIWSRWPLTPAPSAASPGGPLRALVDHPDGVAFEVIAAHPPAPRTLRDVARWADDLDALPAADPAQLRILAGDFNATLDHRQLRRVIDRGYADTADQAGQGWRTTWPRGQVFPPPVTIDHVLVDRRVAVRNYDVVTIAGTDHRGVVADVQLPRLDRAGSLAPTDD